MFFPLKLLSNKMRDCNTLQFKAQLFPKLQSYWVYFDFGNNQTLLAL